MATYTENYNLKKPATTDPVNIEDLNGNADIIDAALNAILGDVTPENNGKVLGIVNGALAAVDPSSVLPDGDEVNY